MKKINIVYSGVHKETLDRWDKSKLAKVVRKFNLSKEENIVVSESYNGTPVFTIKILGESIDLIIDSMGVEEGGDDKLAL